MPIIGTPVASDLSEADVLMALNMRGQEFEPGVILQKINVAGITVDALNRHGAAGEIVRVAKLQLAAYLSYLAYCDAPANKLPGQIDPSTGQWMPIDDPEARINMASKLDALKKAADEAIDAMLDSTARPSGFAPVLGRLHIK